MIARPVGQEQVLSRRPILLELVLLALCYFAAGKLGLALAFVNPSATAVWPPTGIAFAALMVLGYRVWPGIMLGAFLVNITTSGSFPASLAIAGGNTLESLTAAYLINCFASGRRVFERPRDILKFVVLAALASTMVSATVGVTALALNGLAAGSDYFPVWLTWWLGDATGMLLVGSALMLWAEDPSLHWGRGRALEGLLLMTAIIVFGLILFNRLAPVSIQNYPSAFFALPIVVWAALRFGPREAATVAVALSAITIWGTVRDVGPFGGRTPNESLLLLHVFLAVIAITGVILAAILAERKRVELSWRWLAPIVESTDDAVIGKSLDGTILSWNKAAERMYGYSAVEAIGQPMSILAPPERNDDVARLLENIRHGEPLVQYETERMRKDGTRFNTSLTLSPIKDMAGNILGASTIERDTTAQKRAEQVLQQAHDHLERQVQERTEKLVSTVEALQKEAAEHRRTEAELHKNRSFLQQAQSVGGIGSWVSSLGADKRLWWSPECYRIFGIAEGTPIDNDTFFRCIPPEDTGAIQQAVQDAIAARTSYSMDHRIQMADGSERWVFERADVVFDDAGNPVELIGVVQDITERKYTDARVQRLAYRDPVTNLPNRALLFARMAAAIENAHTHVEPLAIVLINISDFRDINDTLGHRNGDRVLVHIAERLQQILFKLDTVARPGADEFVVLLPRLARAEDINLVVRKIADVLAPVIFVADIPLDVRTTIGVALYPEHGQDADTLYQHADVALNVAKARRQTHIVYDAKFDRYDPKRLGMMAELRAALTRDELRLYYQPKIGLLNDEIVGVEALVRWLHPKRGLIMPDEFIPATEKTGLIDDLTQWVLRTAMVQEKKWREAGIRLDMAVNISARNLHDSFLTYPVTELLQKTGTAPERLTLEITEGAIMLDPERAKQELDALDRLGVQLAIDDFGTGYSSLAYLQQLPVRHLKIDKSFVINMRDANNAIIVRSTIELAHNLGLYVTAEGVEDETIFATLKLIGCDSAQGYFISRPLPVDQFDVWMQNSPWKKIKQA